jgi:hypothetical protein
MFEVARSRRMCCSRVESVSTKPRRPSVSSVCPTRRPGRLRTKAVRVAMKPRWGPPKPIGTPKLWASPQTMSAPSAPGGRSSASESASLTTTTSFAPCARAAAAAADTSSIEPQKFGCCSTTQAVSASTSPASGAVRPSGPRGAATTRASRPPR